MTLCVKVIKTKQLLKWSPTESQGRQPDRNTSGKLHWPLGEKDKIEGKDSNEKNWVKPIDLLIILQPC